MTWLLSVVLSSSPTFALEVGDQAPVIDLGDGVDTQGKVVLVNFWATWCGPCKAELPLLQRLHTKLVDDPADQTPAMVVAVNIDRQLGPARGLVKHFGLTMPVVFDQLGELARQYEPPAMPTSYLVDPSGVVREVYTGSVNGAELEQMRHDIGKLAVEQVN